ncbi:MAG: response regulator [Myxococcota bacterium]
MHATRRLVGWLSGAQLPVDEDHRARGFMVGVVLPLGALFGYFSALVYAFTGAWRDLAAAAGVATTQLAITALWLKTRSLRATTHALCGALLVFFGGMAVLQHDWSYLAILTLVPLLANYLSDSRVGLQWSVISLFAMAGIAGSEALQHRADWADPHFIPQLFRYTVALPCVAVVATLFQRGRERAMAQLKEARARSDAANHAKTRFLAAVSHDLRTPLNGILGTVELARLDGQLHAAAQQHLQTIHESGRTLVALINDLLDLSRAEAGRLELSPRPFLPARAFEQVVALHQARAKERGLTLTGAFDGPRDVGLEGDSVRLQQVLHNLVGNAVKFTARGSVEVRARLAAVDAERERWRLELSVRDTGRGISKAELDALFVPFAQARPSDAVSGTGLGLAISKALVEQMRGALSVDSTPGVGSCFTVSLELPWAEAPELTPAPMVLPHATHDGRVLVVDDNAVNRNVAAGLLERMGLTVDVAEGGEDALEALELQTYDLVLMDLQMPDLDGAEVTRRLRAREAGHRRTPVVALTASALPDELAACRHAGMDDTLTKPVEVPRLRQVVETWIRAA